MNKRNRQPEAWNQQGVATQVNANKVSKVNVHKQQPVFRHRSIPDPARVRDERDEW